MGQVDDAMLHGFNGVMLDTVDSPLAWAKKQSDADYQRMRESAITLISDIRHKYPKIKIMLNRGFDLVAASAPQIDYVLAESILTYKDDSTGQFNFISPVTYANVAAQLQHLAHPKTLQILTLDYWDINDVYGVQDIYQRQRAEGFAPYVTTSDLRHFTPEPYRPS
jgi:hypothetical protein